MRTVSSFPYFFTQSLLLLLSLCHTGSSLLQALRLSQDIELLRRLQRITENNSPLTLCRVWSPHPWSGGPARSYSLCREYRGGLPGLCGLVCPLPVSHLVQPRSPVPSSNPRLLPDRSIFQRPWAVGNSVFSVLHTLRAAHLPSPLGSFCFTSPENTGTTTFCASLCPETMEAHPGVALSCVLILGQSAPKREPLHCLCGTESQLGTKSAPCPQFS